MIYLSLQLHYNLLGQILSNPHAMHNWTQLVPCAHICKVNLAQQLLKRKYFGDSNGAFTRIGLSTIDQKSAPKTTIKLQS